jgi:transcription elongation factor Elf1
MSNYSSQLRDRRWQKRRLEILQRDDFTCRMCGSEDNSEQLHVHHIFYAKDTPIWDYPDEALLSVCSTCHADIPDAVNDLLLSVFHRFPDISFFDFLSASVHDRTLTQLAAWLNIPPGAEDAWRNKGEDQ